MRPVDINKINIYPFAAREDLINFAFVQKKSLIAINAEKILNASEQTRALVNQNIGYADGIGTVWALRKKGFKDAIKIPGCELWLDIIRHFYQSKSFYLVGAKEEVIQKTVEKIKKEFPGINLLGYRNGYIKTEEEQELIQTIASQKPDIVFVAMGSPKQELLMQEMQQQHRAIYQGLGGSFDVYVGNMERAPKWCVKNNLEWAYRLAKQPKRILRQYVYLEFFIRLNLKKL